MPWKFWPQPQHRGVQLPGNDGNAPPEAVADRSAQDHDLADVAITGAADPGPEFPAGSIEHSGQDNVPTRSGAAHPVRQHNNAQEVTGGGLPDPHRAKAFDQDEG